MPNPLGLVLGFLFRQCTNPSILETVTKIVNDTQCAASCVALCNVCDWTSERGAPSSKRQISIACLPFSLHKKGITIIVTFLLVELLFGGEGGRLWFWFGLFLTHLFYSQENKIRKEQLEKIQKKFQAVHGNEMSPPWRPPGKVTYSSNYWAVYCLPEEQIVYKVLSIASHSFVTSWFSLNPL